METITTTTPPDTTWWLFTLRPFLHRRTVPDTFVLLSLLAAWATTVLLAWLLSPGGAAWRDGRGRRGRVPIPGPRGLPVLGSLLALSRGLPHRTLAALARSHSATQLMAFSVGSTPAVVSSDPALAREILSHPSFADRPLKRSARDLMFARAMGFAPAGAHWRLLRRIAGSHLFAPHRVAAREPSRRRECASLLRAIAAEQSSHGRVALRPHLQAAALGTIVDSVFGRTYADAELDELRFLVREGFDLLGAFNWSDHLPWLNFLCGNVSRRCAALVPRVRRFVKRVIDERRSRVAMAADLSAFVDVLLSLEGDEKLQDDDMIAVLWEMIFRGTDTTALLTEWVMAELVLHREVQTMLRAELAAASEDADVARLPYLQAVIKETLRVHPPGPLLSWARLSSADVLLSNGMVVPAGTTAMVNMWSITHDASVWAEPERFNPGRFEAADVDVRGSDLRLAPFGAGRRVCPGKNLGMAAVGLWVAGLVRAFEWGEAEGAEVRLDEVLKLSCEMKSPLVAVAAAAAL